MCRLNWEGKNLSSNAKQKINFLFCTKPAAETFLLNERHVLNLLQFVFVCLCSVLYIWTLYIYTQPLIAPYRILNHWKCNVVSFWNSVEFGALIFGAVPEGNSFLNIRVFLGSRDCKPRAATVISKPKKPVIWKKQKSPSKTTTRSGAAINNADA